MIATTLTLSTTSTISSLGPISGSLDPSTGISPPPSHGTEYSDELIGTSLSETILGYGGDDYIYGYGGYDTLFGGGGSDLVDGGDGNDVIYGDRSYFVSTDPPGSDYLDGVTTRSMEITDSTRSSG